MIRLSRLSAAKRRQLWQAIKTQDPAKAAAMTAAINAVKQHLPDSAPELVMSREEINQYQAWIF